jgi:hypothetical protein
MKQRAKRGRLFYTLLRPTDRDRILDLDARFTFMALSALIRFLFPDARSLGVWPLFVGKDRWRETCKLTPQE